jgi:MATE family multidrug resistance protein
MPVNVWKKIVLEAITLFGLTWPTAVSLLLMQSLYFVSLAFCSRIKEDSSLELDAVGFSLSVINITGFSVAVGMGSAVDTLAAQAYGAKEFHKVGVYLQRAILILLLCTLPVYAVWFNLETLLIALHQSPCVVELIVQYLGVYSTCLPALFVLFQVEKYLRAQNVVYPFLLTGIVANVANVLSHVLFVLLFDWGIKGAAAAVSLSTHVQLAVLLAIIWISKLHRKTWNGWSKEALLDWGQFVRYGFPGLVMFAIEEWSFEIGLIVSGMLPDGILQQGIYTILNSFNNILFTIPAALSIAVSIRTGNELGAGNIKAAKNSVVVGLGFCVLWGLFLEAILITLNPYIPKLYTADNCILQSVSLPMYLLSATALADLFQNFTGGVLRGTGTQYVGAMSNVFSYWLTGVPLGIILATVGRLGAMGYWIGMGFAVFTQFVVYGVFIISVNWTKLAQQAQNTAIPSKTPNTQVQVQYTAVDGEDSFVAISDSRAEQLDEVITAPIVHTDDTSNDDASDSEHVQLVKRTEVATVLASDGHSSSNQGNCSSKSASSLQASPPPAVTVGKRTVCTRLFTFAIMLSLCVLAILCGQLFVVDKGPCMYHSSNDTNSRYLNSLTNSTSCYFGQ